MKTHFLKIHFLKKSFSLIAFEVAFVRHRKAPRLPWLVKATRLCRTSLRQP